MSRYKIFEAEEGEGGLRKALEARRVSAELGAGRIPVRGS
jgi:hypothetical protein